MRKIQISKTNTIILGVGLIACAIGLGVYISNTRHTTVVKTSRTTVPGGFNWNENMTQIREALYAAFPEEDVEQREPLSILEEKDVTGDGVPEAFIDMGSGGASVEYVSLVQVKDGKVVVAQWKDADGDVQPVLLLQGASVLHSNTFGVLDGQHSIYQTEVTYTDTQAVDSCQVTAYSWSIVSELFYYGKDISDKTQKTFCAQATPLSH